MKISTDRILFITILVLVLLGLVFVYSASAADSTETSVAATADSASWLSQTATSVRRLMGLDLDGWARFTRQLSAVFLGLGCMMLLKSRHHFTFRDWKITLGPLVICTILLMVAIVVDPKKRAIPLPSFSLQPAELLKPAFFLCLAYFIYYFRSDINRPVIFRNFLIGFGIVLGVVGISDFGTAAVLAVSTAIVLMFAGLTAARWRTFATVALIGAIALVMIYPYRVLRIMAKFDPQKTWVQKLPPTVKEKLDSYMATSKAPRNMGHQVDSSMIAVGSGGILGKGLMQGRQKVRALPEAHNDFIFAVIAEELGLGGALLTIACYLVICWRGLDLFRNSQETFGRFLALGVTCCITLQALINISVALNLGPTKGIPLPLISYGGSSVLGTLILLGLLLSVSDHDVREGQAHA
jgi:cell division protein FtsW